MNDLNNIYDELPKDEMYDVDRQTSSQRTPADFSTAVAAKRRRLEDAQQHSLPSPIRPLTFEATSPRIVGWHDATELPIWPLAVARTASLASVWEIGNLGRVGSHQYQTNFRLSSETLAMIRAAIGTYADQKLPHSDRYTFPVSAIAVSDEQLTENVFEQIRLTFSALARRMAQKNVKVVAISSFLEFLPEIDVMIQSRIPFPPRYMGHLSDQIFAQMQLPMLRKAMAGSWGRFERGITNEIIMLIDLPPVVDSGPSKSSAEFEEL